MKLQIPALVVLLLVGVLFVAISCQKARLNKKTTSSEDNALAEALFDDVFGVADEAATESDEEGDGKNTLRFKISCADVTINPAWPDSTFPKTVTVDFGTGCTGNDGRTRSGIVEVVMTDWYRNEGSVITTTPMNYAVDGYKVSGSKSVTNAGRNNAGNLHYIIKVRNGEITTPDNEIISWESDRVREWSEGEETTLFTDGLSGILDDTYLITGSSTGVNREGRKYTHTITKALEINIGCRWIVAGSIELEPEDLKKRTIDFGDGNCDNEAVVEIDGKSFDINMR